MARDSRALFIVPGIVNYKYRNANICNYGVKRKFPGGDFSGYAKIFSRYALIMKVRQGIFAHHPGLLTSETPEIPDL
jgi:hypothetical protein